MRKKIVAAAGGDQRITKRAKSIHDVLCEALRRFEHFAVERDGKHWTMDDIVQAWTGLGTCGRNDYGAALEDGFMQRAHPANSPYDEWRRLTERGDAIVLAWHDAGYGASTGSN